MILNFTGLFFGQKNGRKSVVGFLANVVWDFFSGCFPEFFCGRLHERLFALLNFVRLCALVVKALDLRVAGRGFGPRLGTFFYFGGFFLLGPSVRTQFYKKKYYRFSIGFTGCPAWEDGASASSYSNPFKGTTADGATYFVTEFYKFL